MKKLKDLTLREKLGQLIMVGFENTEFDEHLRTIIEDYKIGNFIYYASNCKNPKQIINLTKSIYSSTKKNIGIFPLISIDQEGGIVARIKNNVTNCPGLMTISSTNNPKNAYIISKIISKELSLMGINMNLSPCLDVNNNINNPVIGVRSFGDDPKNVSIYGENYIKGLQEDKNLIATAKHFPGHGDTNIDSHLGLPIIKHDLKHLENIEIVPFKNAINSDVKSIMMAHIIFEKMDNIPSSLSEKIMNYLRKNLNFNGIIISDSMMMSAVKNLYDIEKSSVMGIKNGLDIILLHVSLDEQIKCIKSLENAVNNGEISMDIIDEKVERILKIKEEIRENIENNFEKKNVDEIYEILSKNENDQKIAQEIVDNSLTIIKGKKFIKKNKVLIIGTDYNYTSINDKYCITDEIKKRNIEMDTITININPENENEILEKIEKYEQIVFLCYLINKYNKQLDLLKKIIKKCKNENIELFIIDTRNPYDYLELKEADNFACMYEYTTISVNTIIKYLNGEIEANGILPIQLKI